jgi:hypothetical protein
MEARKSPSVGSRGSRQPRSRLRVHLKETWRVYFHVRHTPSNQPVELLGAQAALGEKSLSDTPYSRLVSLNEHPRHRTKAPS